MSLRFLFLAVVFASVFWTFAQEGAQAQQNRLEEALFVSLPVSAQGENEAQAKKQATKIALRVALEEVLQRFVIADNRAQVFATNLSEKNISALTEGLLLEKIRFSEKTFYGQASVRFLREKFFARLHKEGLKVSYTIAPTFLLLPILVRNGNRELWPPQNAWLSTWKTESADKNWLVPIIPIEMTSAERVAILEVLKNPQSLQAALLTEQYRAQGIAIVTARVSQETPATIQAQRLQEGLQEESSEQIAANTVPQPASQTTPRVRLSVSGLLEQQGFPRELPVFSLESTADSQVTNTQATDTQAIAQPEALSSLLLRARNETLYRLNRIWKERTAHAPKRQRLRIIAELQNRGQWEDVKNILEKTPELIDHSLRSLSIRQAHITARHYSSLASLIVALERKGLEVLPQDNLENSTIVISIQTNQ